MPLFFQGLTEFPNKPVQAHLDQWPLQYPLQSLHTFSSGILGLIPRTRAHLCAYRSINCICEP